jgi:hypothetical protein
VAIDGVDDGPGNGGLAGSGTAGDADEERAKQDAAPWLGCRKT